VRRRKSSQEEMECKWAGVDEYTRRAIRALLVLIIASQMLAALKNKEQRVRKTARRKKSTGRKGGERCAV